MSRQLRAGPTAVLFATAVTAPMLIAPSIGLAQIAVEDDPNLVERKKDEFQNDSSNEDKKSETGQRKAVVCTYSNKYRNEMFRRSPQQALARDAANVSLIRHYAKKYGISEGLALSVSYQEARFDTCAGSHTGVKGAMQLTKSTGRGLGFDRDINEQNVEGGVKLLSQAVKKCGGTNYACLASYYNGSTAAEQANWSAGVGRWHGYFNEYAGSGKAPAAAPPPFSIQVSGTAAAGAAQTGGVNAVNKTAAGLEASGAQRSRYSSLIDTLAAGVGTKEEYMDAWDENSTARSLNADLLNQLIQGSAAVNELLNGRLLQRNTKLSQVSKFGTSEGTENPFSCDPVILGRLEVPEHLWPSCAKRVTGSGGAEESTLVPNANAAAGALEIMQRNAQ
ncbi:Membrane-bound lytic murein transglycosylase F [Aquamicrobium terrae]